jgi:DNA-nicking Smr family endonuclease
VDFGDILDQWEKGNREKKKGPAPPRPQPESRPGFRPGSRPGSRQESRSEKIAVDPLTRWLRTHEVYDKDAEEAPEEDEHPGALKRRRARRPDAVIDLHGLNRDQAWEALEQFFETGRRRGYEKLAIIHGKGNHSPAGAVLKRTVRDFIERCPFAGQSGQGGEGGTGATWVLLKQPGRRR